MGISARIFRLPRPRTFLYLMSLRTGAELSILSLLFNKVSGVYGLLALLTGLHLSPLQLSMYIYSVVALIITALLAPHIRTMSPFHCLALAAFYVFDSVINAAYTAAFGITWFLVISQHLSDANTDSLPGPGGQMMGDAAGFTSPDHNVSHVDVIVAPDQGISGRSEDALTVGYGSQNPTASSPSLGHGVFQPESISSVFIICALWMVRVYFALIVMSYARMVLRRHVAAISRNNPNLYSGSKNANVMENPFAMHLPEGKGWKGRIGRVMIKVGQSYWLSADDYDEEWLNDEFAMGRLRRRDAGSVGSEAPGVVERERRRRSGTGPPPPVPQPQIVQGQHLRVQEIRDGK